MSWPARGCCYRSRPGGGTAVSAALFPRASRRGGCDVAPLGEALEEPIQRQHQQLVAQEKVPVLLQQLREEDVVDEVTGEEGSPDFRYFTVHFPCL